MRDQRGKSVQEDERRRNNGESSKDKNNARNKDKSRSRPGHFLFGDRLQQPYQDYPMVISVVVTDYKVERVLVDLGSSANVLFWTTFQKLRKTEKELEACSRTLIGFVGEQVEI
ncbi:hypothetical protein CR513_15352, partial [Mucuna pruriens]